MASGDPGGGAAAGGGPGRFLLSAQGWPYMLVPFIPLAVVLELAHASAGMIFGVAALGIIPTAALMGLATEELAAKSGPGIGGLLNVTFGNAPELIIALFALGAGPPRGGEGVDHRLDPRKHPARDGRGDVRRRARPRAPALRLHRRQRPVADAAAGRGRSGDAGDLRARRGQGPATSRRGDRELRLHGRGAVPGGRGRPDRHLRDRPPVLAEDTPGPLQPLGGGARTRRSSVERAPVDRHARDRRARGRD